MQLLSSTWASATLMVTGVAKDAEQAVSWYRRAAEAGHAAAQFNLGLCYAKGEGVAKDAEQAVSWYRRAAEAGPRKRPSAVRAGRLWGLQCSLGQSCWVAPCAVLRGVTAAAPQSPLWDVRHESGSECLSALEGLGRGRGACGSNGLPWARAPAAQPLHLQVGAGLAALRGHEGGRSWLAPTPPFLAQAAHALCVKPAGTTRPCRNVDCRVSCVRYASDRQVRTARHEISEG